MPSLRSWALAALTLAQTVLGAPPRIDTRASGSVDSWLSSEATIAIDRILSNIGSTGQYATSSKSGIIIASPSTDNPDCMSTHSLLYSYLSSLTARLLYVEP